MNIRDFIREVPDWPKDGIVFKDITPLLASLPAARDCVCAHALAGAIVS